MKSKLYSKKEKCMKEEINVDDKKRKTNTRKIYKM